MVKNTGAGDRIREALLAAGLRPVELARRLKVSQPTVHNWVNSGHGITWANARRVAEALRVSPGWIMFGADEEAERTAQSADELGFLRIYRELDDGGQAALLRFAVSMLPKSGAPPPRPTAGGNESSAGPIECATVVSMSPRRMASRK